MLVILQARKNGYAVGKEAFVLRYSKTCLYGTHLARRTRNGTQVVFLKSEYFLDEKKFLSLNVENK